MPRNTPRRLTSAPWAIALLLAGCATTGTVRPSLVPTRYKTETGPYAIYTNFPLAADDPSVRNLQSLERQIEATLGVHVDPVESPIEVYILDDRKAFTHFLTFYYPELPPRRAFFFAQGSRRVVYTYLGDRLEEDLRHEATHALVHAAFSDLPLWLDEGLAEYFEVGASKDGLNAEHLNRLPGDLASGWAPDLRRLEAHRDVRQMTPRDYRESWAWVHYLLHGTDPTRAALLTYLREARDAGPDTSLADRLDADGGDISPSLLAHLDDVRNGKVATSPDPEIARASTIRLQDEPVATPTPPRRTGPLTRLVDALFRRNGRHAP